MRFEPQDRRELWESLDQSGHANRSSTASCIFESDVDANVLFKPSDIVRKESVISEHLWSQLAAPWINILRACADEDSKRQLPIVLQGFAELASLAWDELPHTRSSSLPAQSSSPQDEP